ncbi:uncharacterized protein LOC143035530 isoform X2 [Oratosquilla oratoria]
MVEKNQQEGTSSVCSDYSYSTVTSEVGTDESSRSFTLLSNCGSSSTDLEASFCYPFSPTNVCNECIACKTCTQSCHECTMSCSQYSGGVCTYDPSNCPEKTINDSHPCHGVQLVWVMDVDKDCHHGSSPQSSLSPDGSYSSPDYHTVKTAFVYPGYPSHHTFEKDDGVSKRCFEKSNQNYPASPPTDSMVCSSEPESFPPCFNSLGFYGPDGCWYPLQDLAACHEPYAMSHSSSQYGQNCSEQSDVPDRVSSSPVVYQGHPLAHHFPQALYWSYSKPCTYPSVTDNKDVCNSSDNPETEKELDDKNLNKCCIAENGTSQGTVQSSSIDGYATAFFNKNDDKRSRIQGKSDSNMSGKNSYPVYNLYQRLDLPHDFLGRPKLLCSVPAEGKLSVEEVWVYHMQLLFKNLPHTWTIHYSEEGTRFLGNWGMFKDHAKVRFYCKECNDGWTSMYGIVMFMYRQNFEYGEIQYQVVGQKCSQCHPSTFEMPLWYPEEAQKVITNLYYEISSKIYGLHTPRTIRTRRLGQPHTQHNHQLCQGCCSGVCRLAYKTLLFEA